MINDSFSAELAEGDQVWFDQQVEAAAASPELAEFAAANTEENFGFVFDAQFADVLIDRRTAGDELPRMFFNMPEFQEALSAWARREVHSEIQDGLSGAVQSQR